VPTIPYRRISVRSGLPPQEVTRRLRLVTRKHSWTVWSQADARFVGSIAESRFRLRYVPAGRNTYAPWLVGSIRPDEHGSAMDVRMTLHPMAIFGIAGFASFPFWLRGANHFVLFWLGAMAAFHVLMYYIGFKEDAWNAESFLHELAP
jgi:hypothetical protein